MTLGNVRLVFLKEMRDTLRDRRTLFISVVLPIFLYPLLMIGFSQVVIATKKGIYEEAQRIALAGGEELGTLAPRLTEKKDLEVVDTDDPAAALAAGDIDAWLEAGPALGADLEAARQGTVIVHFDSTRDASRAAERKIARVLDTWSRDLLVSRGLSEADIEPVKVEDADLASREQRGAKQFGPMLALLLVIMALSGAFYPAVDIMAGEKERGTMETLLVCPATRTEIVAGKYMTVLTMTVITALLNFASMGLTFSQFAKLMPQGNGGIALDISPLIAGVIVLALLPLAGLFSAVALALSTFARTYKEGQHYLSPLFIAVMPLAMVALVPATQLSTFAAVPVAGAVLLVRDLLLGTATAGQILLVLGTTAALAAAAIAWTVAMFNREDVLFRDPGGTQFTLFSRSRGGGATPTPGHSLVLASVALVLIFFVAPRFAKRSPSYAFFVPQAVTLLLPFLAMAWYRFSPRRTLSLRAPRPLAWPAVVIGAPCALLLVMMIATRVGISDESLEPLKRVFEQVVSEVGLPVLLILPPIAEEIFFRGFFLSGMRRRGGRWVAILITAAAFAFFHMEPAKYLTTGLLGLWLGYVTVATGSLYPAILAHLINNSFPLLLGESAFENGLPVWLAIPAVSGLALALYLLRRVEVANRAAAAKRREQAHPGAPGESREG